MFLRHGLSCLALSVVLAACGDSSGSNSGGSSGSTNSAPVVDAGNGQTVTAGATVQLAATATDSDGDALTYSWSSNSGTFSSTTALNPIYTSVAADAGGNVVLTLSVSDGTATVTDSVTISVETASVVLSAPWIVNTTNKRSANIMDGAEFVEVDVLSATQGGGFVTIETNTVPSYEIEVTQEVLDWYEAYGDNGYADGPILGLGNIVEFGDDVGLSVSTDRCTAGGEGWWPDTGGACAETNFSTFDIPVSPTVSTDGCYTGPGPVGLMVNGVPIYNWTDTFSFDNAGIWSYYAVPWRSKGMDICLGHGGGGFNNYHHHSYNACTRQLVNDQGTEHSPVYGFAGDGYPIHGPYHAADTLAKSCWTARDYSDADDPGYCGVDGERTCQFIDNTDISLGTEVVSTGPTTSSIASTDGGEEIAVSGFYKEDFYYEATCTAQGDDYLDQYNGHDHDDLGYHYHTSVDEDLLPTFPLAPAIELRGEAGGSFQCTNDPYIATMGGGPG